MAGTEGIELKVLPHRDEIERAVLGALLLNSEKYQEISSMISFKDFYQPQHQIIFETMAEIIEVGTERLDTIILIEQLRKKGKLEKAGGLAYVSELTDNDTIYSNLVAYAEIIKENSQRRSLFQLAKSLEDDSLNDARPIRDTLDGGARDIEGLLNSNLESQGDYKLGNYVQSVYERIGLIAEGKYVSDKIPTGFTYLDQYTNGGLSKEDYIIIGARPSIGKTAFAISMMLNMIRENKKILFFSLEMPATKIVKRMLSIDSKVDAAIFESGPFFGDNLDNIADACDRLFDKEMYIVDTPNISLSELRSKARIINKDVGGLDCIFIDYIGIISLKNVRSDMKDFERVSIISKGLKQLARELKVPIVVLCQLVRDSEDKEPILSNLRDSGSIEQDADLVCFLHRKRMLTEEEKEVIKKENNGKAIIQSTKFIVGKNRDGETGSFLVGFHANTTAYVDIDQSSTFIDPAVAALNAIKKKKDQASK